MKLEIRIWDGNKYHYPQANENETNHHLQLGENGYFILYDAQGNYKASSDKGDIMELYTTTNDKTGTKIYSGDIIKKSGIIKGTRYYTRGHRGKKEYPLDYKLDGYGVFKVHLSLTNGIHYQLLESDHSQRLIPHSVFFGYQTKPQFYEIDGDIEIIGNIHNK
ncbi:hypothetical protein AV926_14095 [Myroides marinus]|uniref:Uncharacterized protein n=1 Tax=Myroides marinus TaxID=703342 RepID=A0A165R013_9FLAO|nr:hypothetical protein [Myroides marinus]KZE77502.1 hypothetical protein AV926_14095 [Myroides marinus]